MGNDKTNWLFEKDDDDLSGDFEFSETGAFTETIDGVGKAPAGPGNEDRTALVARDEADEKTVIAVGAGGAGKSGGIDLAGMEDPVVGWLVIVEGSGMGRSIPIGPGMSILGRGRDQRIPLPFGDTRISGEDHLRIIYDDDSRSFLVAPGSGKNISKLDGKIIAQPLPLASQATIQLSPDTRVRFVAFCGDDFDWSAATAPSEG